MPDPASPQLLATAPGTKLLDRYILDRPIGAGGMGEVYRAHDTRLGRAVAIKLLPHHVAEDAAWRRRFLNEARSASALNHPNIVSMYDICTDRNVDFLVMEFIDGQTLKDLLARHPLDLNQLASLGSQIALALGAAHAAGIVHRDIKPANIMVTASQQVKVLDFGIARATTQNTDETRLTNGGQVMGTAAYMSPEQTRGEDLNFRSDIFSLGCVLYESAVGQPPFRAPSDLALMHQIATVHPDPPSVHRTGLKPEFVRLVMRCLAKDQLQRPESAVELATELRSLTYTTRPEAPIRSERPSVAVLPLKIRGPATGQYLSVSLAEALIHRLASSGKLTVRPIAAVMRFTGDDTDASRVARELNVDLVIEGTVQIMGDKIRVLVGVHRAADANTIASLKQDGDSTDLFALQDRLADIVANVFDPQQQPPSHTGTTRTAPTKNPAAYELYLRAVDRQVHVDKLEMSSAIDLLLRATELDPTFADAWGLLAQACAQMGSHLDPDPKWFELGERAIARTLELDPIQCTALCARSMILFSPSRSFQNRAALRALNAAIKVDPSRPTARHQRSAILWHLGFLDEAVHDVKVLQQSSPALAFMHQGAINIQRGNFDLSSDFYARALALEPNGVLNHLMAPVAILYGGHLDAARVAIHKARQMFPNDSFGFGLEAIVAAIDGDTLRAETLANEAAGSVSSMTHTHHTWHSCASAYALCGKPDKAIHELERCAAMGLPSYRLFQADPYLKSLNTHPAFTTLMSRLRRDHDAIREEFGLSYAHLDANPQPFQ